MGSTEPLTELPPPPLGAHLREGALRLQQSLQQVVGRLPHSTRSPVHFARALKVHRTLAGRVLKAVRTGDPLAAIAQMPRTEGLLMFLDAARHAGDRASVAAATQAVHEFSALVHGELGGWDALDAAISTWLPDARRKFELANRQQVFKGMSNLAGAAAEVQLTTSIYHPDKSGRHCDIAIVMGLLGLRRVRPGTHISVASVGPNPGDPAPLSRATEEITDGDAPAVPRSAPLLEPFCSKPLPALHKTEAGPTTEWALVGDDIGAASQVDIVTAQVARRGRPLYQPAAGPRVRVSGSAGVSVPVRTLLLTVLLHEDVWPGATPELIVYDTHVNGLASPNDAARQLDRMDVTDSIQPLGAGVARFHAAEVGRNVEMIEHVCAQLGWDARRLRGFRCRAPYPLSHAQYCMVFDPPPAPAPPH